MAEYVAGARTNTFRIRPEIHAGFVELMSTHDIRVVERADGIFLLAEGENGVWPRIMADLLEDGSVVELDENASGFWLPDIIKVAIQPGEVAIVVEAGAERLRYVAAWGAVITSEQVESLNLVDLLVDKAKALSGRQDVSLPES